MRIFFEIDDCKYLNLFGGPYWNRTNNLLIKSQVLCLVELTAHGYRHFDWKTVLLAISKKIVKFFMERRYFLKTLFDFSMKYSG